LKRKTAKAKAVDAAVRVASKGDLFPAWTEVIEALARLRDDRERARVLAASFPLLDPTALRYLQRRLTMALAIMKAPR
jgi:hypothetical protein